MSNMKIYQANASKKVAGESISVAVKAFYHSLIEELDQTTGYCRWKIGEHPSDDMLEEAINQRELYLGIIDQRIAACMVINQYGDDYQKATWDNDISEGEYLVIHVLGVHQDFRRRGLAKEMVQFAIDLPDKTKREQSDWMSYMEICQQRKCILLWDFDMLTRLSCFMNVQDGLTLNCMSI